MTNNEVESEVASSTFWVLFERCLSDNAEGVTMTQYMEYAHATTTSRGKHHSHR